MKIVAMVVREMNFMRRDIGQIIMAAAITDDTAPKQETGRFVPIGDL